MYLEWTIYILNIFTFILSIFDNALYFNTSKQALYKKVDNKVATGQGIQHEINVDKYFLKL